MGRFAGGIKAADVEGILDEIAHICAHVNAASNSMPAAMAIKYTRT
jgi:hypothetical protein